MGTVPLGFGCMLEPGCCKWKTLDGDGSWTQLFHLWCGHSRCVSQSGLPILVVSKRLHWQTSARWLTCFVGVNTLWQAMRAQRMAWKTIMSKVLWCFAV